VELAWAERTLRNVWFLLSLQSSAAMRVESVRGLLTGKTLDTQPAQSRETLPAVHWDWRPQPTTHNRASFLDRGLEYSKAAS